MEIVLRGHDGICLFLIRLLLTMAVWVEQWRGRVHRRGRRLRGSLREVLRDWRTQHVLPAPAPVVRRGGGGWNRTPRRVEQAIVRLHAEAPHLGAGQLGRLAQRVLGFRATRETLRRILLRNQGIRAEIEIEQEKRNKRRIVVHAPRKLWGMDLTLVWVLGFFPVWVLGIVDYHGSRLVALEPLSWPTAAAVVRATQRAFAAEGAPERVLTDRGGVFRAHAFEQMLSLRGVTHTLTRPRHPWTNGRIERVFRTWKETIFAHYWLVPSLAQLTAICADFVTFYNDHRPHSAYGGRTPDEVHAGRPVPPGHAGRIAFFEGRLLWWRFS